MCVGLFILKSEHELIWWFSYFCRIKNGKQKYCLYAKLNFFMGIKLKCDYFRVSFCRIQNETRKSVLAQQQTINKTKTTLLCRLLVIKLNTNMNFVVYIPLLLIVPILTVRNGQRNALCLLVSCWDTKKDDKYIKEPWQ